jgi:hypothetical protein
MKVAILISGRPRFTKEFDDLLDSLTSYDQLDWYFLLWNATHEQDVRIPPTWPNNVDDARKRIESKLPERSNIAHLSISEPPAFDNTKQYNLTPWSVAPNIWTMYYGIYAVNQIRKQNGSYDLIIRTRPDIGITEKLDLTARHQQLISSPPSVLMPSNHRHGMWGNAVNDLFGIALPNVMDIYADAFNHIDEYNSRGVPFHGETVLAHHLSVNNIQVPNTDFHSVMRLYTNNGQPWVDDTSIEYGRWNQ